MSFWTLPRMRAFIRLRRAYYALDGLEDAAVAVGLADRPVHSTWLGRVLFGRRSTRQRKPR
ncbi:hypothetical protein [Streptomyces sp. 891-h]|uniref:hypothetical protein n=1 Tax=Streptomyces sp. 891-h TaxID=2720714 RepID=UPI001FA9F00C|nr:hypothetical protein [Streptomyces sp. 891-h]UNZ21383.1 hypothetical protein HC362_34355 [Streptomyces sp. 891-h]